MEDQQKFNQLLNEINVYKQQGDLIQQQIELVRASIAEVDALTCIQCDCVAVQKNS